MPDRTISKSVIKRLPVYLRILDQLIQRKVDLISSKELSNESGFTAEQIRKDLAHFGAFGTRGAGYNTTFLREKILKIIGLDKKTDVVVFGAGHLGTALTRYNTSKNPYVNVVAVFDIDQELIGTRIAETEVMPLDSASALIKKKRVKVALLAVPVVVAQEVASLAVDSGINAILNFAPAKLTVPEGVHVHDADLTIELQSLIYYSSAESERLKRLQHELQEARSRKTLTLD